MVSSGSAISLYSSGAISQTKTSTPSAAYSATYSRDSVSECGPEASSATGDSGSGSSSSVSSSSSSASSEPASSESRASIVSRNGSTSRATSYSSRMSAIQPSPSASESVTTMASLPSIASFARSSVRSSSSESG